MKIIGKIEMLRGSTVFFRIKNPNRISDIIYIYPDGIQLYDTSYPQPEVDYEKGSNRLKIIGVDVIEI